MSTPLIIPDWPAPSRVRAISSTRKGGVSPRPWDSLNLGDHVGDDSARVGRNRQLLAQLMLQDSATIHWLEQVHGDTVVELPVPNLPRADASTACAPGHVCAILTADCLPVLFCDRSGMRVAAAHAGWRGLLSGVLEKTIAQFEQAESVIAWLGPAIGPASFEVGPEVRDAFLERDPGAANCFRSSPRTQGRFLADIYELARRRLRASGVTAISGGDYCTVQDPETFFSFRRDGQTGRQASLIWLEA